MNNAEYGKGAPSAKIERPNKSLKDFSNSLPPRQITRKYELPDGDVKVTTYARPHRYVAVPAEMLDTRSDRCVSETAAGVWMRMHSMPAKWGWSVTGFTQISKIGRTALSRALGELEEKGWFVRARRRDSKNNTLGSSIWVTLTDLDDREDVLRQLREQGFSPLPSVAKRKGEPKRKTKAQVAAKVRNADSGFDLRGRCVQDDECDNSNPQVGAKIRFPTGGKSRFGKATGGDSVGIISLKDKNFLNNKAFEKHEGLRELCEAYPKKVADEEDLQRAAKAYEGKLEQGHTPRSILNAARMFVESYEKKFPDREGPDKYYYLTSLVSFLANPDAVAKPMLERCREEELARMRSSLDAALPNEEDRVPLMVEFAKSFDVPYLQEKAEIAESHCGEAAKSAIEALAASLEAPLMVGKWLWFANKRIESAPEVPSRQGMGKDPLTATPIIDVSEECRSVS